MIMFQTHYSTGIYMKNAKYIRQKHIILYMLSRIYYTARYVLKFPTDNLALINISIYGSVANTNSACLNFTLENNCRDFKAENKFLLSMSIKKMSATENVICGFTPTVMIFHHF
jgi:hypothetical protein